VGDRARILASLELVNYVAVFDDTRAEAIIRHVRPDVLIKGEDYRGKTIDGQEFVESYGGRVVLAPLLEGHSTTETIAKMRTAEAGVTRGTRSPSSSRRAASSRTPKRSREP
jgi:D-beta-D-heptose 7-phosphate kinase/D-beta-D-heptose 1-phosphate adenosyltransferase